jgi:hypothetical protein
MEKNNQKNIQTNESKTIQKLQNEKILLNSQLFCQGSSSLPPFRRDIAICKYPKRLFCYTEFNHNNETYLCVTTPIDESIEKLKNDMNHLKHNRYNGYSALGAATMAEGVWFEEKRTFIQKLLAAGFEPTQKDRELALVEKYERCILLRQKIYMLYYILNRQGIPHELIDLMAQLTFETEKSLF